MIDTTNCRSHQNKTDPTMTEATPEAIAQAYEDLLDDVHTRFLLNLPPEELATSDRIFFQLEQAWWFYDDFHCDNSELPLPRFKSLKPFALKMFQMSPMLDEKSFDKMWVEFSGYKRRISNYGTILMNQSCTKMILCKVYQSNSWTFPAGKVNQNETGLDSGARETYEETGFDPNCCFGLTKKMREGTPDDVTWRTLQEEDALVYVDPKQQKRRTMYVCKGVPEDFPFAPVARKEVSVVAWHSMDEVPKKSFAVLPFMKPLRRWIKKNKKKEKQEKRGSTKKSRGRASRGRDSRGRDSRGRVRDDDPLTETGLANAGEASGWTEKDMFHANEALLGRKVEYDGNPHLFAEKGFDGRDPHAFHVVGGSFMNSSISSLAPPPDQSKLQPLFARKEAEGGGELMPFFSSEGETPWGEVVAPAAGSTPARARVEDDDDDDEVVVRPRVAADAPEVEPILVASNDLDVAFMTDAEITARSQLEKEAEAPEEKEPPHHHSKREESRRKHANNKLEIQSWVDSLQQAPVQSKFQFNVEEIMGAMNAAMG